MRQDSSAIAWLIGDVSGDMEDDVVQLTGAPPIIP
jgi:hypothetical protein